MITILSIGKLKMYNEMFNTYLKRIQRYTKINVVELKEVKDRNEDVVKEKEGKHIVDKLDKMDHDYTIVMDPNGKQLVSEDFASILELEKDQGKDVVFVVGGPVGVSPEVLEWADVTLSVSKMTLQHDLAKLVLIDQIYRAYTILHKKPYHK